MYNGRDTPGKSIATSSGKIGIGPGSVSAAGVARDADCARTGVVPVHHKDASTAAQASRWCAMFYSPGPPAAPLTSVCFLMNAGSMSMPDPGPVGTVTTPFSVFKEDVLHSNGTSASRPLNS